MSEHISEFMTPEKGARKRFEFTPGESVTVADFRLTSPDGLPVHYFADMFEGELLIYSSASSTELYLSWPISESGLPAFTEAHVQDESGCQVHVRWEVDHGNHSVTFSASSHTSNPTEILPTIRGPEVLHFPEKRQPIFCYAGGDVLAKTPLQTNNEFDPHYTPRPSEDFIMMDHHTAVYGIADGVGSARFGGEAASLAMDIVKKYAREADTLHSPEIQPVKRLVDSLRHAHEKIMEAYNETVYDPGSEYGSTTATIAQLDYTQEGQPVCSWASIGDSRLYRLSQSGQLDQITVDDGEGYGIRNYLGRVDMEVVAHNSGQFYCRPGEMILLMSDGISDQLDWDVATETRFIHLLVNAAHRLKNVDATTSLAKYVTRNFKQKRDDRSIIIIPIPQ